jgi:hypothetical protein
MNKGHFFDKYIFVKYTFIHILLELNFANSKLTSCMEFGWKIYGGLINGGSLNMSCPCCFNLHLLITMAMLYL